jgi:translocator protein
MMQRWLVLAALIALCLGVGAVAGFATSQSIDTWYVTLVKPSWTPPNWLFGPAWTVLYIMMAIAAWLVWKMGDAKHALKIWAGQLALNFSWSFLFFGAQSPGLGLINIIAMWLAIAATIFAFAFKSRLAAFLMVPYLCWVSYATALNIAIYTLN